MTPPIAGDTFISGGDYYHVITLVNVGEEQLAICSNKKIAPEFPVYARHLETDELIMDEGVSVTMVESANGNEEYSAIPVSYFGERLGDGNPLFKRVENYVEAEPLVTGSIESVEWATDVGSTPDSEDVVEPPDSVTTASATVEAVEKTEGATEVDVAVSVPDEDTEIQ